MIVVFSEAGVLRVRRANWRIGAISYDASSIVGLPR